MNTFGTKYCFTSFGESHGPAVGGVIDGCPAGIRVDMDALRSQLQRRSQGGSARAAHEADEVEWLSGLMDGITLGTPIAFLIRNTDARSADYEALRDVFRPGHADYTYQTKYGIRDYRGGGRASARETAARVVAGAVAKQILAQKGIRVMAELVQVGEQLDPENFAQEIEQVRAQGDSIGGIVACKITGVPAGLGEPIFDKMQARLAYAMLSINACKGFEYGAGFASATQKGSESNAFSGGMLGGITDGTDIVFRVAFKPTPSISLPQTARNMAGDTVNLQIQGRHDACVAVRAVPVVEAMAAMVMADFVL